MSAPGRRRSRTASPASAPLGRGARSRALIALPLVLTTAAACVPAESAQERSDETRIAEAILAAPASLRDGATVVARTEGGRTETLRAGSEPLICLTDDPSDDRFQVSCYHEGLEPYMERGRRLRAEGVTGSAVDRVRFAEIEEGSLSMPDHPAALYTLGGPEPPADPFAGPPEESQRLFVLYVPGTTPEQLGLPAAPEGDYPWLMAPGTPEAHLMFTP